MVELFEGTKINNLALSNRFVRSATWEGMAAEDGSVTSKLIDTMIELARGGVGLIISGHSYVSPEGQASPWQLGIDNDTKIAGLSELTKAVHDNGGKIVLQAAHAGVFANRNITGHEPLVVSYVEGISKAPCHEASREDINRLVSAYAAAALRAKTAGFDGIQIHAAHGYLLSQFLSNIYNRRTDEYGGEISHRVRIHLEIIRAVRNAVGKDFPVMIKMNCRDFSDNGLELEDSLEAAKLMVDAGLDAIEISGGLLTGGKLSPSRLGINTPEKEAYFQQESKLFRQALNIPIILVGGARSYQVAEKLIQEGAADYISMSRPLIREPGLIGRWRDGDQTRAKCLSDNLCFAPALEGKGIYCVTAERKNAG